MSKLLPTIQEIQKELNTLSEQKTLAQAQRVILAVIRLLDDSVSLDDLNLFQLFADSDGKIRANGSWFFEDQVVVDRKATYKIHSDNKLNIDFKLYGVTKPSKRTIAWAQALTPNFEDEPFNTKFNVGIDFIVPKSVDKIIIVLSNQYVVRTLELKGALTVTFQEILAKWAEITDFSNKKEVHSVLWESFDLQPLNKKFYAGIRERFITLRQHLTKENILDDKHSSLFSNRLIGRVIFCWFLDKKGVINPDRKYFDANAFDDDTEYYRKNLENLFFGVLNTPIDDRDYKDDVTPFLNGGLFEARDTDLYKNSKLTFPKNYFDDLFEFLSGYNFTTDESTSQFQQVAIDPEMLGRIFENLLAEMTEETGEQARKAKGAFYTPREIVDYMCRESLREYLKTKIPEDEFRDKRFAQLIDAPDKDFQDQDHNWRRDWKPYKDGIIKALDDLKVLDPACGSGAFPIGMLQLLVRVYERLEPRFDNYKAKLQVIENNIYGVDIEPMAIEIARLRAWLSIVVDEGADSKNIKPLPNLEFKFICANSLINLDQNGHALGDDPELADKLQQIRDAYFDTGSLTKKKKLRNDYEKLVNISEGLFGESLRSKQLKTYRPFDNEASSSFFNPIFMFGVKTFDLIIGNPPYNAKLTGLEKEYYKKNYLSVASGRQDTAAIFVEFAYNHQHLNSISSFILPYRLFSRKRNHGALQEFILNKLNIKQILYLGNYPGFETVSDEFMVVLLERTDTSADNIIKINIEPSAEGLDSSKSISVPQKTFIENSEININYSKFDRNILHKIRAGNPPLSEICEVRDGIIPYLRDKMISHSKIDERYVPFAGIAGKYKLEKYYFEHDDLYLCYDINEAKKYIKDVAELRKVQLRDRDIFLHRKIITSQNSAIIKGTIDENKLFVSNSIHSTFLKDTTSDYSLEFVLACLNSSAVDYYHNSLRLKGTDLHPQILVTDLKKLPIPARKNVSNEKVAKVENLVNNLISLKRSTSSKTDIAELENELDNLIMDIYQLTEEEKNIVRKTEV